MQLTIDSDFDFTQNFYQADGTTALDLSTFNKVKADLMTATGDLIVSYTYNPSTGNFVGTGTTGEATLKFDHADNTNEYTGIVFLQYYFKTTDAAYASGYKEMKLPSVQLFEIISEKPNPEA